MIKESLRKFFSGDQRSVKAKKNIVASFFLKGISIFINLLLIPLTIDYLSPTKYGIWITLVSVINWFNLFDVGLGNGLRNKFTTAKAEGRIELAQKYISTTYAILTIISAGIFLIFLLVNQFLDWGKILNTQEDLVNLERLVFVVFSVFSLQFVVKLINVIFIADQRPAMSNVINTAGSLLSLVTVIVLMQITEGSLLYLGASFSLINLLVPFVAGMWFFNTTYTQYKPSFKSIDFSYLKELVGLGGQFFIMQVAALIVFTTDSLIIAQVSGPQEVTPYNIAYKYFGIITVFFTIVTKPYWSAFTDAYVKKENEWIKRTIQTVVKMWLGFVGLAVIMLLVSDLVYTFWIGSDIHIPFDLSAVMALYTLMASGIMIFGNFLNAIEKIRLSIYHALFFGAVNIPLSIFFAKNLEMGNVGVMLATCCGVFVSFIIQPVQSYKIITGTAKGLWNK